MRAVQLFQPTRPLQLSVWNSALGCLIAATVTKVIGIFIASYLLIYVGFIFFACSIGLMRAGFGRRMLLAFPGQSKSLILTSILLEMGCIALFGVDVGLFYSFFWVDHSFDLVNAYNVRIPSLNVF